MWRKATIWITEAFCMSPMAEIKAIASLIPIHLHLQKLNRQFLLQAHLLSYNHIISSILESRDSSSHESHHLSVNKLIPRQCSIIKDSLVDIDNRFNKVFPSFSPFNYEFSLRNRLIDIFPNHFSFHSLNRKSKQNVKNHLQSLDNITIQASSDPLSTIVVMYASIKNQVTILIAHIHRSNNPVIKTIHHAVNITSTEAKLFAIRCGIN